MKRDLDLVRKMLLSIEQPGDGGEISWAELEREGYELSAVNYHLELLNDAGLIKADELVPGQWWPERMTWAGHEFLDAARDERLWEESRRRVERRFETAPFEIVHELLVRMARDELTDGSPSPRRSPPRKK